ncbi:MAG: phosphoenolpyruvate-utilizing N-terminal domain-containing protein, partial [Marmoricola sp.]
MVTTERSSTSSSARPSASALRGTPVVPGLAHGPVVLASADVDADAVARFTAVQLDPAAALERYDGAVAAVSARYAARAGRASGAAAEVLVASAGLARDKGLRAAVRKALDGGVPLLDAVDVAVEKFVGTFTAMGGLMAERVTDLHDIRRRVLAELVGAPEPGAPDPEVP